MINVEDNFLQCDDKQNWIGTIPTCTFVECYTIVTIDNGVVNGTDYAYSSILLFTCNDGYQLVGNSSIVCTSQGIWNSSEPFCNSIAVTSGIEYNNYADSIHVC